MKVQLLLLVALVGPFCAFTRASPTGLYSTEAGADVPSPTITATELVIITSPPPTKPHTALDVVDTSASFVGVSTKEPMSPTYVWVSTSLHPPADETAALTEETTTTPSTAEETTTTPSSTTEETTTTTAAPPEETTTPTAAPPEETTYPAAAPPEIKTPTDPTEDEVQSYVTENHSMSEEVTIDESNEEGLNSGQIVGIVIGAILTVVVVIAVVFAFVRRMGKYSP